MQKTKRADAKNHLDNAAQSGWAEEREQIGDWTFWGTPPQKCVIEVKNEADQDFALEFYYSESNGRSGLVIAHLNDIDFLPKNEVVKFHLYTTDEMDPELRLPIYYNPNQLGRLMFISIENPCIFTGWFGV